MISSKLNNKQEDKKIKKEEKREPKSKKDCDKYKYLKMLTYTLISSNILYGLYSCISYVQNLE